MPSYNLALVELPDRDAALCHAGLGRNVEAAQSHTQHYVARAHRPEGSGPYESV
jgi:hypothetical protein